MSRLIVLIRSLIGLLCILLFSSWGFYAHKRIGRMAIYALPEEMYGFYNNNSIYLSEHTVDPDKRRYVDDKEGGRHFLDTEDFGEGGLDSIPKRWNEALKKYGQDFLERSGTVPWQIERSYYILVNAFKANNWLQILKLSAELSHYVSDAHVPLHVTSNYNGQLSGQEGIHSFFESRLPELFASGYQLSTKPVEYIESPLALAWTIVSESCRAKDSVFTIERRLRNRHTPSGIYGVHTRRGNVLKTYSHAYAKKYETALNGLVERRMRASIFRTACLWYSAWVDAGQPALPPSWRAEYRKTKKPAKTVAGDEKILGRPDL